MPSHASSALCPRFQLQEHTTGVDKAGRMNATSIPSSQVARGAGSWEKAFVALADVLLKPFGDNRGIL